MALIVTVDVFKVLVAGLRHHQIRAHPLVGRKRTRYGLQKQPRYGDGVEIQRFGPSFSRGNISSLREGPFEAQKTFTICGQKIWLSPRGGSRGTCHYASIRGQRRCVERPL